MKKKILVISLIILFIALAFVIWHITKSNTAGKFIGLIVSQSDTKDTIKVTIEELGNQYDYDIYYYGLDSVSVKFKNKTIDLKEALETGQITMEKIIEKANEDLKKNRCGR